MQISLKTGDSPPDLELRGINPPIPPSFDVHV